MNTPDPSKPEGERRVQQEDEEERRQAPTTQTTPSQAEGERDDEDEHEDDDDDRLTCVLVHLPSGTRVPVAQERSMVGIWNSRI
jgi:hypothetical protein